MTAEEMFNTMSEITTQMIKNNPKWEGIPEALEDARQEAILQLMQSSPKRTTRAYLRTRIFWHYLCSKRYGVCGRARATARYVKMRASVPHQPDEIAEAKEAVRMIRDRLPSTLHRSVFDLKVVPLSDRQIVLELELSRKQYKAVERDIRRIVQVICNP